MFLFFGNVQRLVIFIVYYFKPFKQRSVELTLEITRRPKRSQQQERMNSKIIFTSKIATHCLSRIKIWEVKFNLGRESKDSVKEEKTSPREGGRVQICNLMP